MRPDDSPPARDADVDAAGETPTLGRRLTRPRTVVIALVITLVAVALLTPEPFPNTGSLSARDPGASGAMGFAEVAERLGWPVEVRARPLAPPLDTSVVYLVLEPPIPLRASEIGAVLDAVRAGGGLVVSAAPPLLADSLERAIGVRAIAALPRRLSVPASVTTDTLCPPGLSTRGLLPAPGGGALITRAGVRPAAVFATGSAIAAALPLDRAQFEAELAGDSAALRRITEARRDIRRDGVAAVEAEGEVRIGRDSVLPAVAGFTLGAGRVLYAASPSVLRNDVLRHCPWGADMVAIRGLEWVSAGERPPLVFDEYHHGAGQGPGLFRRVGDALLNTAPGRTVLTVGLGLFLLMLTRGARPLAPAARLRYERRSALEHVDALARAYAQVGATRTAARRLVRGLRRRHAATTRIEDDDAFLARVAERHPRLAGPVTLLRQACTTPVANADMPRLVAAVDTVDSALTHP